MRKKILLTLIALPIIVILAFLSWALIIPAPMPEALAAAQSDASIRVEGDAWLAFTPTDYSPDTGLILYPGGRVDYRAYAPLARQIARQGYLVVIVRMPLNLAVFNPQAAASVMEAYPDINVWAVGGHSLGGSMAAFFADGQPQQLYGLVLWASYPADSNNLTDNSLDVVSIFGTLDGLATPEKIEASRPLLPPSTTWIAIDGGNHAQFGWYGDQPGDNPAAISREEQQRLVVAATTALLARITASLNDR